MLRQSLRHTQEDIQKRELLSDNLVAKIANMEEEVRDCPPTQSFDVMNLLLHRSTPYDTPMKNCGGKIPKTYQTLRFRYPTRQTKYY
jgi:hypothetical protein